MKSIPISLSPTYAPDWSIWEASRELIQNGLDQDKQDIFIDEIEKELHIKSYGSTIPLEYLLLGGGSKTKGDGKRGVHNEGLKVALLVLCREPVELTFYNGNDLWTPVMAMSDTLGVEHLHINIQEDARTGCEDEVSIIISHIENSDIKLIQDNTLYLQEANEKVSTRLGDVLLDERHKGRVYCGGLFVSYFGNFDKGYDIHQDHLELDRDRNSLQPFDVKWLAKDMMAEMSNTGSDIATSTVADLIISNSNDTSCIEHSSDKLSEEVKDKVFEAYQEKHAGKVIAESYEECEKLKSQGIKNVVFTGNSVFAKVVKQSSGYKSLSFSKVKVKTNKELLDEWKDSCYNEFSLEAMDSYDEMSDKIDSNS